MERDRSKLIKQYLNEFEQISKDRGIEWSTSDVSLKSRALGIYAHEVRIQIETRGQLVSAIEIGSTLFGWSAMVSVLALEMLDKHVSRIAVSAIGMLPEPLMPFVRPNVY